MVLEIELSIVAGFDISFSQKIRATEECFDIESNEIVIIQDRIL